MSEKDSIRVLIIGLDGGTLDLIKPWIDEGELPTLKEIRDNGVIGELKSTTPPISGPAWSSFITGKNPGKTGVFDFLYREKNSYEFLPINSNKRDGKPFWSILSEYGKKVGVVNVPVTYPVEKVNGFMISGWMTPFSARDYTYPTALLEELKDNVGKYRLYPDATYSAGDWKESFIKALNEILEIRIKTTLYLMKKYPWDFFITVLYETDLIQHQMWHYIDPHHPWCNLEENDSDNPILEYFQKVDSGIQQILQSVDDDTVIIVMSDHGMGPCYNYIFLNNWLVEEGLLVLKNDIFTKFKRLMFKKGMTLVNIHKLADRLKLSKHAEYKGMYFLNRLLRKIFLSFDNVDWSKSVAYSFGRGFGPIYINLKGREPRGIVEPGKVYEEIRDKIIKMSLEFRDPVSGEKIVSKVLKREEIYWGPHFNDAPDLLLIPVKKTYHFYGLSDFGSSHIIEPTYRYSAVHRDNGLVIIRGKPIKKNHEIIGASIEDIAPTVLYLSNIPIPRDMDGRVLEEIFEKEFLRKNPKKFKDMEGYDKQIGKKDEKAHFGKEEEEIKERLRGLGYMG